MYVLNSINCMYQFLDSNFKVFSWFEPREAIFKECAKLWLQASYFQKAFFVSPFN